MRPCVTILLALATLTGTPALAASPPAGAKTQFIEFDPHLLEGTVRGPVDMVIDVVARPRFARLLALKKDLLPHLSPDRASAVLK